MGKLSVLRGEAEEPPGPQRPRRTTLEGEEEQFHVDHNAPAQGQRSVPVGGTRRNYNCSDKREPTMGTQHSPNGKPLPGSPAEISPHGDPWGHLWCWTSGDPETWRRWVGLTATSAQILEDSQTRLCSTLKSHPIRDHSDSAHFLS